MPRLVPGANRTARTLLVILAIAAMLCVSVVAVSPSHAHLTSPADQCNICATAHMAVQQVVAIQVVHNLELRSFLPPRAALARFQSRSVLVLLTRGPPSSL